MTLLMSAKKNQQANSGRKKSSRSSPRPGFSSQFPSWPGEQCQHAHEKAEQAKRNLAAIESPNRVDFQIEQKQAAWRMRLIKLFEEGKNTFGHMDVQQTWCVGQAHLQHGFLRRVLVK